MKMPKLDKTLLSIFPFFIWVQKAEIRKQDVIHFFHFCFRNEYWLNELFSCFHIFGFILKIEWMDDTGIPPRTDFSQRSVFHFCFFNLKKKNGIKFIFHFWFTQMQVEMNKSLTLGSTCWRSWIKIYGIVLVPLNWINSAACCCGVRITEHFLESLLVFIHSSASWKITAKSLLTIDSLS